MAAALAVAAGRQSRPDCLEPEDDLADQPWASVGADSSAVAFPAAFEG